MEGPRELVKAVKAEKTLNTVVSSKASTVGGGSLKRKKSQPLKPVGASSKAVAKVKVNREEEEEEEEDREEEEEKEEEEEDEVLERGETEEEPQLLSPPPLFKKKKLMGTKLMKAFPPKPPLPFKVAVASDVVRLGEGKFLKPKPNILSRHPKPQGEPSKKDKRVAKAAVGNAVEAANKPREAEIAVVEDFEVSSSEEEEENVEDEEREEYYPQTQEIVDTLF